MSPVPGPRVILLSRKAKDPSGLCNDPTSTIYLLEYSDSKQDGQTCERSYADAQDDLRFSIPRLCAAKSQATRSVAYHGTSIPNSPASSSSLSRCLCPTGIPSDL